MKNIVKVKLTNDCHSKLQFVKNVKELCGIGLKESKDIVDRICLKPLTTKEVYDKLTYNLDTNIFEVNGGTQWQREIKMLQLGVGERQDYIDFLKQHIQTNFGNSEEMLTFVLDKLTQEQLQETIDKIKY